MRINLDFNKPLARCFYRLEQAFLRAKLLEASDVNIDKFNDSTSPFNDEILKIGLKGESFDSEKLLVLKNEFNEWSRLEIFNYIIASLIEYIDDIITVLFLHEHCIGKDFPIQFCKEQSKEYNGLIKKVAQCKDIDCLIKITTEGIKRFTELSYKLNKLKKYDLITEENELIISQLYNTRNAIEHWFSYPNPISFKTKNDLYVVQFPKFKLFFYPVDGNYKEELFKNTRIENSLSIGIEITLFEKVFSANQKIGMSYNDIVHFNLWTKFLIENIHKKINLMFSKDYEKESKKKKEMENARS